MPQHLIELNLQPVKLPYRKQKFTELISLYEPSFLFLLQGFTSALQLFITINQTVVTADVFLLICNLDGILRHAFADVSREYMRWCALRLILEVIDRFIKICYTAFYLLTMLYYFHQYNCNSFATSPLLKSQNTYQIPLFPKLLLSLPPTYAIFYTEENI